LAVIVNPPQTITLSQTTIDTIVNQILSDGSLVTTAILSGKDLDNVKTIGMYGYSDCTNYPGKITEGCLIVGTIENEVV